MVAVPDSTKDSFSLAMEANHPSQNGQSSFVPAPIPRNEPERIVALRSFSILDSAEEDIYNSITQAAADVCQTPMASLTFIDTHRQWFKSRVGLSARETPRDVSFCGHAINGPDMFVVEDALQDSRFCSNPFVLGDPNLRFYAGMPLMTQSGLSLGTLCVLDTKPRHLSDTQLNALTVLAHSAMRVLQLRKNVGVAVFAKAVDMASDGVTISGVSDRGMTIMYANESFSRLTGFSYFDAVNQQPTFPVASDCPDVAAAVSDATNNAQMRTIECEFRRKDGAARWARVSFVPYVDDQGTLAYLVTVHHDITVVREAETQSQQLYAMRTTMATISHVVNNFLNSAQLYSIHVDSKTPVDPTIQKAFASALENTRSQLTAINRMSTFRERPTPFGFSLLDTDEKP